MVKNILSFIGALTISDCIAKRIKIKIENHKKKQFNLGYRKGFADGVYIARNMVESAIKERNERIRKMNDEDEMLS